MILSLSTRSPSSSSIWRLARSYATHHTPSSIISSTQSNHGQKIFSTQDDHKLTASISVFIKAGSRYEPSFGTSHLLKNMVFKSTQKRSALSLVRETELLGGLLTSSLSREHLILSAEFLKGNEGYFAEVLGDVLTCSKFTRHEFNEEVLPGAIAEYNQAQLNPTVVALEQAHQLAFRRGLGNSLFANPQLTLSHESAAEFARSSFGRSSDQSIVATGIPAENLTELVNQFFSVPSSTSGSPIPESTKSSYHGGESRILTHGPDVFLIAFKGADGPSKPEFTVLQHLLGSDPVSIKWSNGTSPLSSLPVKSFHLSYSDLGLFGFLIKAPGAQAKTAGSKALAELKNIANGNSVDKESVAKAVAKAQFLVASSLESNSLRTEILGTQSLISPKASQNLGDLYSSYSDVTPEKVIQAAKSVISSKPTIVAVGNTQELPYFDELGF